MCVRMHVRVVWCVCRLVRVRVRVHFACCQLKKKTMKFTYQTVGELANDFASGRYSACLVLITCGAKYMVRKQPQETDQQQSAQCLQ